MQKKVITYEKWLMLIGLACVVLLISKLRYIGFIGLAIIIFTVFFSIKKFKIEKFLIFPLFCIVLILFRFLLQFTLGQDYPDTFRSLLSQVFIYFYLILIRNSDFSFVEWKWIFSKYALVLLTIGIYLLLSNQLEKSDFFSSMFGNFLLVGFGITMILTRMELDERKRRFWAVSMLLFILLTYFSGMRSAVLGECLGLAFSLYSSLRNGGKKFNTIVFALIISICFAIPYVYLEMYLPTSETMAKISELVQSLVLKYTSKRMFSGRDVLWPYVINSLKGHQLFGRGIGYNPAQIYNTAFSTHNLFLFIRLEQGYLGFFSFVGLLYAFWKAFYQQNSNKVNFYVQGFMVAILIQQTFSLGLVGGKGAFSIGCWTVLAALSKQ